MTSKDIARELGLSPHTVDQRLRVAIRTLGVASRVEAARLLAQYETDVEAYQSFAYQPSPIDPADDNASREVATEETERRSEREYDEAVRERQLSYDMFVPAPRVAPLPFPHSGGEENHLNGWQRLGWVMVIAIGSALSFGAVLSGLGALADLL